MTAYLPIIGQTVKHFTIRKWCGLSDSKMHSHQNNSLLLPEEAIASQPDTFLCAQWLNVAMLTVSRTMRMNDRAKLISL